MKKMLSYVWPVINKIESTHSGTLEVTLVNGKKMLDSENANYSYGSLQRILDFGLSKIDISSLNSVLVLGMGGGCVIQSLRDDFNYKKQIVAVELDEEIIKIAADEFGIKESNTLSILKGDAMEYATNCKDHFDLIIIDLFIDTVVPKQFHSKEFGQIIKGIMKKKGFLIFNLGFNENSHNEKYPVVEYFKNESNYTLDLFKNVEGTNSLLILKPAK